MSCVNSARRWCLLTRSSPCRNPCATKKRLGDIEEILSKLELFMNAKRERTGIFCDRSNINADCQYNYETVEVSNSPVWCNVDIVVYTNSYDGCIENQWTVVLVWSTWHFSLAHFCTYKQYCSSPTSSISLHRWPLPRSHFACPTSRHAGCVYAERTHQSASRHFSTID